MGIIVLNSDIGIDFYREYNIFRKWIDPSYIRAIKTINRKLSMTIPIHESTKEIDD